MQRINLDDTIAAISTAMGSGGIGIVRLSGKKAVAIADKVFIAKNNKKPSEFKSYMLHFGWIVKNVQRLPAGKAGTTYSVQRPTQYEVRSAPYDLIDEALLVVMRAPKSYTREDMVEISCHGSSVSLKSILNIILEHGARLAEPGEFTKRAFRSGRIDLTQ